MTATVVPQDLLDWREQGMRITGLGAVDFGIAPDASHKSGGGYHCGVQDIINIGKFPDGDYSTRQQRDRVGGNVACAADPGDNWPNGGRAAWLRFNNLLVKQLRAKDPALSAVRAVNFSPDGTATKRFDTLHPESGIIDSTDSVYMHTHIEFWRNTEGKRKVTLDRVLDIMRAAVANRPLEDDVELSDTVGNTGTVNAPKGRNVEQILGDDENWRNVNWGEIKPTDPRYPPAGSPARAALELPAKVDALSAKVDQIQAGQVSQEAVTAALVAALKDPAIRTALTAVAEDGANLAEDS